MRKTNTSPQSSTTPFICTLRRWRPFHSRSNSSSGCFPKLSTAARWSRRWFIWGITLTKPEVRATHSRQQQQCQDRRPLAKGPIRQQQPNAYDADPRAHDSDQIVLGKNPANQRRRVFRLECLKDRRGHRETKEHNTADPHRQCQHVQPFYPLGHRRRSVSASPEPAKAKKSCGTIAFRLHCRKSTHLIRSLQAHTPCCLEPLAGFVPRSLN